MSHPHREPTDEEKVKIEAQHTRDGQVRCYVNDHPIAEEGDIEYHHIKPFSEKGPTEVSNLAPVCKEHHRRIGVLSITEFRTRLDMERFFKVPQDRKLDDVLSEKVGDGKFGKPLSHEVSGNSVKLYLEDKTDPIELPLHECPATHYKYFSTTIPFTYIKNDEELQPRPLDMKRLWELYGHLLTHTQIAPAVCRLTGDQLLLFDGQHKSAAQIWAGRNEVECKVYVEPDIMVLKETNLAAHDKFRQMPFFTSVLISKWADIFKVEWEEYLQTEGEKSEAGFVEFLVHKGKKKIDALNMIRSSLYNSILDDAENKAVQYVEERNRARENPLTINALKQTIFSRFIAAPPLEIKIEASDELREFERKNVINLMNTLVKATLDGKWNPDAKNNAHKTAERYYASGSLKAWSTMLRDVICAVLRLYGEEERQQVFLRKITADEQKLIDGRVERIFSHKLWTDPSPEVDNNLRVNNEQHVKEFFESKGLKVDWVLGNS